MRFDQASVWRSPNKAITVRLMKKLLILTVLVILGAVATKKLRDA